MSTINEAAVLRFYLDTQEYSDRLTAIEAQAASNLATQKSEVAAAIAQVNLTQSQTITALTLEVNNLKTTLIDSITATQTEFIDRADQLAQDVTDITVQLTQDKATFTQEIQDALDFLKDDASVASALRTPRKIQGVDFDGTQDINLPVFTSEIDGLVPKRVGTTTTKYLREDGTWEVPTDTTYALLTKASAEDGTATTANTISAQVLKEAIQYHAPTVTNIVGNAGTASKLQTSRTISLTGGVTGSVSFDGSTNASITTAITGLGVANGIATLDSSGQVPSTQLPSYVDDVLEYENVAAFPATGETGKIYVETAGNITYRWSGSGYAKITSGEVASVAGKTGVVNLSKADVGLPNVDDTADSVKSVATAAKLTTTRTLTVGRTGKAFDGSANVEWTATEVLPSATSGQFLKFDGTNWVATTDTNTTYSAMSQAEADTGTDTSSRVITAAVLKSAIQTHAPVQSSGTGNAATATKLQTPRAINGVLFDGSGDITIDDSAALTKASNLSDVDDIAEARTNLDVYSKDEVNEAITTSVPVVADATTIDKGIVRLATESDITNSSETAVVTPKNVNDMLVGVGASAKGFRALFSARLTQMTGTNTSSDKTITCTITAHGLSVGDVVSVNYGFKVVGADMRSTDTVAVTSVANANTFTFTSPQNAMGSSSAVACILYYAIKNNYNVNSLTINSAGRYTISINTASGITGTSFISFIQATTADNSLVIVQPEAITSATSLTVRTFNAAGTAITPQWLHIGVIQ